MREIEGKEGLDLEQQNAQSTLDDRQEELFRPIADRVHKIVEGYAKELNLAVVVNATEDMLYANDVVDITTEIIRRVNADILKNPAKPK
jgi:Skp family chaperone for outer membrane proteins